MTTPFEGSGMCLWFQGLQYVTFLPCKNAQNERRKVNEVLTSLATIVRANRGTYKIWLLYMSCNPLTGEGTTLFI